MSLKALELSAPQMDILQAAASRYLLLMGQGGGKTTDIGFISYMFAEYLPGVVGLIAANTYGQLSDSTLLEVFKIWKDYFGWEEWSKENPEGCYVIDKIPPPHFVPHGHTFKSNNNKIFLKSGAVIMTVSLDNFKALEGRTIGWALLDETADTRVEAIKEVITARLRAPGIHAKKDYKMFEDPFPFVNSEDPRAGEVVNPLFIFTKPVKEQWLTEFFDLEKYREEIIMCCRSKVDYFSKYDKEFDRVIVIASSYHNSDNLPPGYISQRKKELTEDVADLVIYGNPFGKTGQEYYKAFKRDIHVTDVKYVEGCPIMISFDFNVNPYMTGKVWITHMDENNDRRLWKCLKEYAFSHPKNSIEAVCKAMEEDWGDKMKDYGMFYYGDASGKNSLPLEDVKNFYKVIEDKLWKYVRDGSRRILKKNMYHKSVRPGSLGRRALMNKCFLGLLGFDILIDPSCKHSIRDFEFILEDVDGSKKKSKKTINGVVCEDLGHMSDADDAIFCYHYGDEK